MNGAGTREDTLILLVDDEPDTLHGARLILRSEGFSNVHTLSDPTLVMDYIEDNPPALVVLDIYMPELPGTDLLPLIHQKHPDIPVLMMTAANDIETAVECMQAGAEDFLVKPVEKSRFITGIKRALKTRTLESELENLKESLLTGELKNPEAFIPIVTRSPRMRSILQYIEAVGPSSRPVLITGETGTGKELFAKALHDVSGLDGAFVPVNVAGLDDTVFSDTLFGHTRGAFTGAVDARQGLIAKAAGGTLFLDEIGDLGESSQVKLLRLLQDGIYFPLGSDSPKRSEARIAAATNRDLEKRMNAGTFRRDLYFRIKTHMVEIPAMRERKEDIPALLDHFLDKASRSLKKKRPTPPPELTQLLTAYHFPGNIRELEAMVFDAVTRHTSGMLSMQSFRDAIGASERTLDLDADMDGDAPDYDIEGLFGHFPSLKEVETFLIDKALKQSADNQGIAAGLLGISRQALNKRLNRRKDEEEEE